MWVAYTGLGLCCLTPLSTILTLYRGGFISEENGAPGENHYTAANHWQSLSHNVVSSTPGNERDLKS